MINTMKISICVGIALSMLLFSCEKKKNEIMEKPVSETIKTIDYAYNIVAFKRNVNWSANDETWQPVTVGLGIAKGCHVETGEASAATLNGTLGDIVMLGEKAKVELLIEKLQKQADGSSLATRGVSLLKGTVRFAIAKGIGTFIVKTPSVQVNVKGTDFVVTYDEKSGLTDVLVREGLVDVDDKKYAQKTYSLSKGQTLVGAGTTHPVKRIMTLKETAVFEEFVSSEQSDSSKTIIKQQSTMPKETPEEIRSRLSAESNAVSSTKTNTERLNAQSALDNERTTSQKKIDSVQADYQTSAQAEKDTFADRKAVAKAVVDSTKNAAKSTLDAERAKFKAATGSLKSPSSGKADDAFDELNRRKMGR